MFFEFKSNNGPKVQVLRFLGEYKSEIVSKKMKPIHLIWSLRKSLFPLTLLVRSSLNRQESEVTRKSAGWVSLHTLQHTLLFTLKESVLLFMCPHTYQLLGWCHPQGGWKLGFSVISETLSKQMQRGFHLQAAQPLCYDWSSTFWKTRKPRVAQEAHSSCISKWAYFYITVELSATLLSVCGANEQGKWNLFLAEANDGLNSWKLGQ